VEELAGLPSLRQMADWALDVWVDWALDVWVDWALDVWVD
jgi:hypothetical protein